jgi:hypothetical protein
MEMRKDELRDEELEFVAGGNKWLVLAAIFALGKALANWISDL